MNKYTQLNYKMSSMKSLNIVPFVLIFLMLSCTNAPEIYNPIRGEGKYILTPKTPESPSINGPAVFGVRPGAPFLYTIPATGNKPLTYSVKGLPKGLEVNQDNGIISGTITDKTIKDYSLTLKAKNNKGETHKTLTVKVGDAICLTPPLGWNSWNCWSRNVSQKNVLLSANAMVDKGLKDYGWTYINIDDVWQGERGGKFNAIQPNPETFPNIKAMADEIHQLGLKVGIYSSPWVTTYAGFIGGSSDNEKGDWERSDNTTKEQKRGNQRIAQYTFDTQDANQWAEWGIDYLKYDWNPNEPASTLRMAKALRNSGRDIVYSLSNSAPLEHAALFGEHVHCFRTAGDLKDRWDQKGSHLNIRQQWERHREWIEKGFSGAPSHFPDPDMLVVGHVAPVGDDPTPKPSRLTADEQYSHISLWSLWSAPLLIGAPIEMMDEFTVKLLTNAEVLAMHQDEIAIPGKSVVVADSTEIVVKELINGEKAIGLFNISANEKPITVTWEQAGIEGKKNVRDLWRQQDIGKYNESFTAMVPSHGVVLVKIK